MGVLRWSGYQPCIPGVYVFTFRTAHFTNGWLVRVDCTNILCVISNVYLGTELVVKSDDTLQN